MQNYNAIAVVAPPEYFAKHGCSFSVNCRALQQLPT
jgi:hypothetical protein